MSGSPERRNIDRGGIDRTRTPTWVQNFVHEAESFPNGAYDDQIDAMVQALTRLERPGLRIRWLP